MGVAFGEEANNVLTNVFKSGYKEVLTCDVIMTSLTIGEYVIAKPQGFPPTKNTIQYCVVCR